MTGGLSGTIRKSNHPKQRAIGLGRSSITGSKKALKRAGFQRTGGNAAELAAETPEHLGKEKEETSLTRRCKSRAAGASANKKNGRPWQRADVERGKNQKRGEENPRSGSAGKASHNNGGEGKMLLLRTKKGNAKRVL